MNHSFDIEHAQEYGVDEAILIHHFQFWIAKNQADGRHRYEDRWWTYTSIEALTRLFPYWTRHQLTRIVDSLEAQEVVLKRFDLDRAISNRVSWYAFQNEERFLGKTGRGKKSIAAEPEMVISANPEMVTEPGGSFPQTRQSFPQTRECPTLYTDSITDIHACPPRAREDACQKSKQMGVQYDPFTEPEPVLEPASVALPVCASEAEPPIPSQRAPVSAREAPPPPRLTDGEAEAQAILLYRRFESRISDYLTTLPTTGQHRELDRHLRYWLGQGHRLTEALFEAAVSEAATYCRIQGMSRPTIGALITAIHKQFVPDLPESSGAYQKGAGRSEYRGNRGSSRRKGYDRAAAIRERTAEYQRTFFAGRLASSG